MTTDLPRYIAHLDMDAFYASVELLRYPALSGQAVVIGGGSNHHPILKANGTYEYARLGDYVGRGVVTTSTYEARAFKVFSGMGLMKAAKLAPMAILLPTDFDAYRKFSRMFKTAVAMIAPQIEDRGIDEIYIDLTDTLSKETDPSAPTTLAWRIKNAVKEATGLTCSIGIAPNKLLAKIGSELNKPNGVTVINFADMPTYIWPLAVSKINGIGPKAAKKLALLGVQTIFDLAHTEPVVLQEHFGRGYSEWLLDAAHGVDLRAIVTSSEPKSMSRESTFSRDLDVQQDRIMLGDLFTKLCQKVAADLQRKGYVARTVGLKLRFSDFSTVTRDVTLLHSTSDAMAIRRAAGECLRRIQLNERLRLLGVRVTSLSKSNAGGASLEVLQGDLFRHLDSEITHSIQA